MKKSNFVIQIVFVVACAMFLSIFTATAVQAKASKKVSKRLKKRSKKSVHKYKKLQEYVLTAGQVKKLSPKQQQAYFIFLARFVSFLGSTETLPNELVLKKWKTKSASLFKYDPLDIFTDWPAKLWSYIIPLGYSAPPSRYYPVMNGRGPMARYIAPSTHRKPPAMRPTVVRLAGGYLSMAISKGREVTWVRYRDSSRGAQVQKQVAPGRFEWVPYRGPRVVKSDPPMVWAKATGGKVPMVLLSNKHWAVPPNGTVRTNFHPVIKDKSGYATLRLRDGRVLRAPDGLIVDPPKSVVVKEDYSVPNQNKKKKIVEPAAAAIPTESTLPTLDTQSAEPIVAAEEMVKLNSISGGENPPEYLWEVGATCIVGLRMSTYKRSSRTGNLYCVRPAEDKGDTACNKSKGLFRCETMGLTDDPSSGAPKSVGCVKTKPADTLSPRCLDSVVSWISGEGKTKVTGMNESEYNEYRNKLIKKINDYLGQILGLKSITFGQYCGAAGENKMASGVQKYECESILTLISELETHVPVRTILADNTSDSTDTAAEGTQ